MKIDQKLNYLATLVSYAHHFNEEYRLLVENGERLKGHCGYTDEDLTFHMENNGRMNNELQLEINELRSQINPRQ